MQKTLFSISCTTCTARLAVRSADAIGAIVACPKCGSMVQIAPPDDWVPPGPQDALPQDGRSPTDADDVHAAGSPPVEASHSGLLGSQRPPHDEPPGQEGPRDAAPGIGPSRGKHRNPPADVATSPPVGNPAVPRVRKHRKPARPQEAAAAGLSAAAAVPPSVSPAATVPPVASGRPGVHVPEPPPVPGDLAGPPSGFASPVELLWRKWLVWSAVPLAVLLIVVGSWAVLFRRPPQPPQPDVAEVEQEVVPAVAPEEPAPEGPDHFDLRWLPDRTALIADLRIADGVVSSQGRMLLDALADWWHPAVAAPLQGLRLDLQAVRRIRIASADLAAWPNRLVLLVELNDGHDATLLELRGKAVPIVLGEATCRRLDEGWTHPFAVLDERTLLTGDEAVLVALAGRAEPEFQSDWIRSMLESRPSLGRADARLLVDLGAARAAGWQLPAATLDVWPEASLAWRTILEVPAGFDAVLQWPDRLRCELTLACESETAAEEVRSALDGFVPLLKQAVGARAAALAGPEAEGGDAPEVYSAFLTEASTALQSVAWRVDDTRVLVEVDWGAGPWTLAAATLAARSSLRADWLEAALGADAERQRQIMAGLIDYQQAEGAFPPGAAGGSLLPPETRLSWIAEMLPYLGHPDWHRSLRFGYAWNSPQNRPVTRRQLDRFVNPAMGPHRTAAGYPVTHYVGVAGVGPDAATLPADHPRAGVFGFGRRTRLEDIGDGASNTIAILGVTGEPGAWAAGGHATVRPLTTRPYVNGPDGFGSGQLGGMLAGMADGSVRFISKDIDPEVVELLATINSGSQVTVAALGDAAEPAPKVAEPSEPAEPVEPRPEPAEIIPDEPGRAALPAIDVAARLAEPVPQFAVSDTPLGQAVALLAQLGGVPVTFDPWGLESLGVSLRDPVSVRRDDATLATLLEAVLAERGLVYIAESGQVIVTCPEAARSQLVRRRYSVDDLAADEASVAELGRMVQDLVEPESWQSQGGPGSIEAVGGTLNVEQTAATHHRVLVFCEKLRRARGLPVRSRFPVEWFQLSTRRSQAAGVLEREVTANFREPTPLIEVLGHLGGLAGADIVLDRRALAAEGISDMEPASVAVVEESFEASLDKLLRPLGLAWRALDAHTIQVSTQAAMDETMELEFYPVAPLLDGLVTGQTLIEQICTRIAGPTWSDAGGPGVIRYHAPSRHLIVRHNQAVQAAVERLLGEQAGTGR